MMQQTIALVLVAIVCGFFYFEEAETNTLDRPFQKVNYLVNINNYGDSNSVRSTQRGPGGTKKQLQQSGRSKSNRTTARKSAIKRIVHPSLHAAWDEYNHLCILAKFQASFTIKYETASGSTLR